MDNTNLTDPRKQYYSDDFPEQDQGTPALQHKMKPKPDCGESSYKGHGRLEGRNALITGGDSGIGRAAAIAYAREGANVAIQFVPGEEADAQEVKEIIENEGRKSLLLPCDFRDDGTPTDIVKQTVDAFGALDILVLNSALQVAQPSLSDLTMEQVNDTFKVNIISMFESVKAAEEYLEPGSAVITTTSVQGSRPGPPLSDYAATNAAINNFTVSMSKYFAPKGIRVNGVAPGPVWTPLQLDGGKLDGEIPEFGQKAALTRAAQPVELAPVYVLLASEEGSYISGEIYGLTGGKDFL